MAHSTATTRRNKGDKPSKPYRDFPLTAHANGSWCKKIKGKLYYFGSWDDPQAALQRYLDCRDDLQAGRNPKPDGCKLRDLCNAFLTAKESLVRTGELTHRSFDDYKRTCKRLIRFWGLGATVESLAPEDFAKLKDDIASFRKTMSGMAGEIQRCRTVFKFACDEGLIPHPLRFGGVFKRPSRKSFRRERATKNGKAFTREECLMLLDAATQPMRSMILLGLNGGLGNHDIGQLRYSHFRDETWLRYPRFKTGIKRLIPLWTETIDSLADYHRPTPRTDDLDDRVFLTKYGKPWSYMEKCDSPISSQFARLQETLRIRIAGRSFYGLRHTFETIAGGSRDQVAVDAVMGHVDSSMAATYRHSIEVSRLISVTEYVRRWLFGEGE